MWLLVVAGAWLLFAAATYFPVRDRIGDNNCEWTVGDRNSAIVACLMAWPLMLLAVNPATGQWLDNALTSLFGDERPAKW